jgi:hypothetical protein
MRLEIVSRASRDLSKHQRWKWDKNRIRRCVPNFLFIHTSLKFSELITGLEPSGEEVMRQETQGANDLDIELASRV